jgi:hypothetical protein
MASSLVKPLLNYMGRIEALLVRDIPFEIRGYSPLSGIIGRINLIQESLNGISPASKASQPTGSLMEMNGGNKAGNTTLQRPLAAFC